MSSVLLPPDAFRWTNPTPTSIDLTWRRSVGAVSYELHGGGTEIVRVVRGVRTLVKGLPGSSDHTLHIRAVDANGNKSAYADVVVFTSVGIPQQSPPNTYIKIADADRQSFRIGLPSPDGDNIDCLMTIWWHPSDESWWASLEAPIGTPVVQTRRMPLNVGLLSGIRGVLGGDIVIRQVNIGGADEPTRQSFVDGTHRLAWEGAG